MRANHGYAPHLAAPRYRALGIVVIVHLALGGWLLRGAAPLEQPMRRLPLPPVLIQDVMIAPSAPQPQPLQRLQPSVNPPQTVVRLPAKATPARSPPRPEPALRPAAPAVREGRPVANAPPPTPMASPELPSAQQVLATTGVPTAGQPALSSAPMPSAAPAPAFASALARPGPSALSQPQPQPQAGAGSAAASGTAAASADIALVCPTQVAPLMPRLALRGGITGVVQAQAVIVDGVVRDVRILSGLPVFHNAVRTAMRQYRCASNRVEVMATQEFIFKVD